jgi:DNA invertase Pin-like site-specific DNA recombinase
MFRTARFHGSQPRFAVLGGLADVERNLIRSRTAEGRSRAQKRGQHMGRPSKLTDAQRVEARRRRAQGATRTRAQLRRGQDHDFSTNHYCGG